jgi:phenylpropionate dioxygenase-like ring-hydroxylating dioxygenase large terminal subunit
VEQRGLRCCYHGWLYDVEGNVLEMPLEPAPNPSLKQIQHPCYPVREFGGLVFAYMGPPERLPEFPIYDIWQRPGGTLKARLQLASGRRKFDGCFAYVLVAHVA